MSDATTVLFQCSQPDFFIHVQPENVTFGVNKSMMADNSGVFCDMFGVCDSPAPEGDQERPTQIPECDIHENAATFALLLALLHTKTKSSSAEERTAVVEDQDGPSPDLASVTNDDATPSKGGDQQSATFSATPFPENLPFPIITALLDLADKYDLVPALLSILHDRLRRKTSTNPLEVYGLAHQLDLLDLAIHASSYLLDPPLHRYSHEDIQQHFPSLKAYHRLVLLHGHRKEKLRTVLMGEELFPHNYRACQKHREHAEGMWRSRQRDVAIRLTAGMDVPSEMALIKGSFQKCENCSRACEAAIGMLEYKIGKVPRTFDRVPGAL